jgi:hypothetical protein
VAQWYDARRGKLGKHLHNRPLTVPMFNKEMKMATICLDGAALLVGKDFADCFTGQPKSRGAVEVNNGQRLVWQSTLDIEHTERALRRAAQSEGKRVTFLQASAA